MLDEQGIVLDMVVVLDMVEDLECSCKDEPDVVAHLGMMSWDLACMLV